MQCAHFGLCGGCPSYNISYSDQLHQKEDEVYRFFTPLIGKSTQILPILASPTQWRYRNKMEFTFRQTKDNKRFLGLYQAGGRGRVVDLKECLLVSSWFSEILENVRAWWEMRDLPAYFPPKDEGILRTLVLREGRHTGDRMAVLTIVGNTLSEEDLHTFTATLHTLLNAPGDSIIVRRQYSVKGTPTRFEEEILWGKGTIDEILRTEEGREYRFKMQASSFFQPNPLQAEKIYQLAMRYAAISKDMLVYDLCCGAGTLGIFASAYAKTVFGIDLNADAVKDTRENIQKNGISNMQVFQSDVSEIASLGLPEPDLVIVDPPRPGLVPKVLQYLKTLAPKMILYISCNPEAQAANISTLLDIYELTLIHPIDQFPNTRHVENIARLVRKA